MHKSGVKRRLLLVAGALAGSLLAASVGANPAEFAANGKPTVLITGANASHGLAFVEVYSAQGWNVIASCRSPDKAEELNALAAGNPLISVEELDIVDQEFVTAAQEANMAVQVWTINSCEDMLRMMEFGVDGIMTDRPLLLEELLNTPADERQCD